MIEDIILSQKQRPGSCFRCGREIPAGGMYCPTHQRIRQAELREANHVFPTKD